MCMYCICINSTLITHLLPCCHAVTCHLAMRSQPSRGHSCPWPCWENISKADGLIYGFKVYWNVWDGTFFSFPSPYVWALETWMDNNFRSGAHAKKTSRIPVVVACMPWLWQIFIRLSVVNLSCTQCSTPCRFPHLKPLLQPLELLRQMAVGWKDHSGALTKVWRHLAKADASTFTLSTLSTLSMQGIVPCQALPTIPVFRGRGTPDFGHFWANTWNRNLKALWMAKEGKIRMSPSWLRLSCQFLVEIKLHPAKRDSHTSWIQKLYLKFNPTSNYRDAPSTWYDHYPASNIRVRTSA